MVSGLGKGLANMDKGDSDKKNKSMSAMSGSFNSEKAPSPNDAEKESNKDKKKVGTGVGFANASASDGLKENKSPSPNDGDRATHSLNYTGNHSTSNRSNGAERTQGIQQSIGQTDSDIMGVATSPSTAGQSNIPASTINAPNINGTSIIQKAQGIQQSNVQTDTEMINEVNQSEGRTSVQSVHLSGNAGTSSHSTHNTEQSAIQTENITVTTQNEIVHQAKSINEKKGNAPSVKLRPSSYSIPNKFSTNQYRNK